MMTLDIDPLNPSHPLACGAVLELLAARHPEVMGAFDETATRFTIEGATFEDLDRALHDLCHAKIAAVETSKSKDKACPLILWGNDKTPPMRFDWYLHGQPSCKTWCGNQTALDILTELQGALASHGKPADARLFFDQAGIAPGGAGRTRTRFDPRTLISKANVGFSANEAKMKLWIYYATEVLAFVGFQTFRPAILGRPARLQDGFKMIYALWTDMLPVELARYVFRGGIPEVDSRRYAFAYERELQGKDFYNFTYAWPL